MRGKKAKQLRRIADTVAEKDNTTYWRHNIMGNIVVDPTCARGIYRALKKGNINDAK